MFIHCIRTLLKGERQVKKDELEILLKEQIKIYEEEYKLLKQHVKSESDEVKMIAKLRSFDILYEREKVEEEDIERAIQGI